MTIKTRVVKLEVVQSAKAAPGVDDGKAKEWLEKAIQRIIDGTQTPAKPLAITPVPSNLSLSQACLHNWLNEAAGRENREN
jgi:hypothetical protein